MREIKFRGLTLVGREWYYWGLFDEKTRVVDPATVGQFSGLSDENGTEIYEGDIVYVAGFGDCETQFPFLLLHEASCEGDIGCIVGNIHENKEMLEHGA